MESSISFGLALGVHGGATASRVIWRTFFSKRNREQNISLTRRNRGRNYRVSFGKIWYWREEKNLGSHMLMKNALSFRKLLIVVWLLAINLLKEAVSFLYTRVPYWWLRLAGYIIDRTVNMIKNLVIVHFHCWNTFSEELSRYLCISIMKKPAWLFIFFSFRQQR